MGRGNLNPPCHTTVKKTKKISLTLLALGYKLWAYTVRNILSLSKYIHGQDKYNKIQYSSVKPNKSSSPHSMRIIRMKLNRRRRQLPRNLPPRLLQRAPLRQIRHMSSHVNQRDLNLMQRLRVVARDGGLATGQEGLHPSLESSGPWIS